MAEKRRRIRPFALIVGIMCLLILVYLARGLYHGAATIHELLTDNKHLKKARCLWALNPSFGLVLFVLVRFMQ